jgi:DNA polymerase-3 subunit gamma/tau
MKWAPNKRLHFEVAVIKAIQTLNQVTLNEVIENLAALRDGKPQPQSAAPAKSSPKPPPAPPAVEVDVPRVAEQVQQRATVEKTASPAKEEVATPVDHKAVWQKVGEQVRSRRRLISPWVEAATALGTEGRFLVVGFPPQQKTAMESLSIPRTREFLEALIKEISGHGWNLKFVLKEGLPVAAPMEAPTATPLPKKQETQATFKDDPLIREALEIFKGEIKTVSD